MATSSEASETNPPKSHRPSESAFKQQRLPAWQPILTAGTVLPTFFVIGIAFIPVGIGLLYFSDEVKEHVIDYTYCLKEEDPENKTCAEFIKEVDPKSDERCLCAFDFELTEDFKGNVYFYYGLSNYYQNHRRYVKSRDDNQLLGHLSKSVSSDCEPFAYVTVDNVKTPVAPCGAIANSLFNDSFVVSSYELAVEVPVLRTGIAWKSDKEIKFRNPKGDLQAAFANFSKPMNWRKNIWELDPENPDNNGFQNEDLIVWMRTAALPTFRKLYRRVDHSQAGFANGLGKGKYEIKIEYNYPVTDFHGTKSFIISTTSLLGGKNPFLGVAYIVVGTLCLVLGIILLVIHVKFSKRPMHSQIFSQRELAMRRRGTQSASRIALNKEFVDRTSSRYEVLRARSSNMQLGKDTQVKTAPDKQSPLEKVSEPQAPREKVSAPQSLRETVSEPQAPREKRSAPQTLREIVPAPQDPRGKVSEPQALRESRSAPQAPREKISDIPPDDSSGNTSSSSQSQLSENTSSSASEKSSQLSEKSLKARPR